MSAPTIRDVVAGGGQSVEGALGFRSLFITPNITGAP